MQKTEINLLKDYYVVTNGKVFAIQCKEPNRTNWLKVRFLILFSWNNTHDKFIWTTRSKKFARIIVDKLNKNEAKRRSVRHQFWEKV